ncbi:TPA: amidohydrolase family protein [Candidatus Woesearchaeota archaeon]|nr:amidohydrolase family protein [Candidatus Woesearchaeota archaeon]
MKKEIIIILLLLVSACAPTQNIPMIEELEQVNKSITETTVEPLRESPAKSKEEKEALTIEEEHWKRMFEKAFAEVDCPAPRDPKSLPQEYYKGPMIDAHIHIHSLPDGQPGFPDEYYTGHNLGIEYSIAQWICMMDSEGTSKSLAFFAVWDPITQQSLDLVKKTMEKYPGRFIPFIMPPDNDGNAQGSSTVDARELSAMLSVYPGLFKGYGEIGLYGHPGGAPALPPDSPRLMEIYPVVREHNLLVYFHLGEGQKEAFETVLTENPNITFIFHGDQLVDCGTCDGTLDNVAEILENHPNVYYGVDELYGDVLLLNNDHTKEEFIAYFKDYAPLLKQDLNTWKEFIEKHPNQVLWDTDRGVGSIWSIDPEVALTLNNYSRAFIGRLDPTVQEKFAYQNAERLLKK